MKKIVSLVMALLLIASCIPVGFAQTDVTEYTAFNLWYTPDTHVKKGETIQLAVKDSSGNALTAENADLSFESLNPAVATVDADGNVTGVNPGIAVIGAKLSNNKTELPEAKIAITVVNGNTSLQSFEATDDAAWPTTMPRTGARSYIASANGPASAWSYRNSSGTNVEANRNFWGGANRAVASIWFYDDGSTLPKGGSTVFLQSGSGKNILSVRVDKADYYVRAETAEFVPTITQTAVNNRPTRSAGWHQVIFDMTKANMGDGTGERKVYLDGEVIFVQSYTFETYIGVGQICVQSNYTNITNGAFYFDDMNGYGVTRDYKAKAVVTDLKISQKKNVVTGTYNFYDANDSEDNSACAWQISETEDGKYTDISGATEKSYTVTGADNGKYIRLKVVPNNSTEAVYSNAILAEYSSDTTEYTSFNLWYTPDTHVKKGETIPLTVKDGEGNVLTGENADISFKSLNPAVATVDENGNVKGVNPGIAVIKAKLTNSSTSVLEEKIAIAVITGKVSLQSFESVDDTAWPTTKPRTGNRSYIVSKNVPGSSFSYRNSSGAMTDANKNNWGGANRAISSIWFYDDGCALTNGGATVLVQNSSGANVLSLRTNTKEYYAQGEKAGFNPTITSTDVNNTVERSTGWHQVVFDMSKGNMGDGTGERTIYLDGEIIFRQEYTFTTYAAIGQICVQSNRDNVSGAMFYDDMNGYGIERDYSAKPVVTDVTAVIDEIIVKGEYSFHDANDAADASAYQWQVSDSVNGEFKDITGATAKAYSLTANELGKYIRFKVTPANSKATGTAVYSKVLGPVEVELPGDGMPLEVISVAEPEPDVEGYVKTTVKVKNNTLGEVSGKLITALYSGEELVSVHMENITLNAGEAVSKYPSLKLGAEESLSIDAYVWDDMETMVPLAKKKTVEFLKSDMESPVPSSKEDFHVYLCIGQSNMAGRAPILEEDIDGYDGVYLLNASDEWEAAECDEYNGKLQGFNRYSSTEAKDKTNGISPAHSFAKKIAAENSDITVGIVSNARGGTSIDEWMKGAESGYYEQTVARARKAMRFGTLKGILWHQGESNQSTAGTYISKLSILINDLRNDLGIEELPFVAGQILPSGTVFNNMIVTLPEAVSYTACVTSEGTTDIGDGAHFDNASAKLMGERYAEKISYFVYR